MSGAVVAAASGLCLGVFQSVLLLAPIISGRRLERVTLGLWAGAGLVISGALVLVAA